MNLRFPLLFTFATVSGWANTLHVSLKGSDLKNGTSETPFATIQDAVNAAKPGDTIRVAPGVYREKVTFPQSGTPENPITLEGESPLNTIISAAERITTPWTRSNLHPSALQTNLTTSFEANDDQSTQVYWNGKALTLARWPNLTPEGIKNPSFANRQEVRGSRNRFENFEMGIDGGELKRTTEEETDSLKKVREFTFRVKDPNLPTNANWAGANIYIQPGIEIWSWTITGRVVEAKDQTLVFKNLYNAPNHGNYTNGFRYWIENHPSLLDSPGEWWIDEKSNTLHLIPPDDTKNPNIEIRAREICIIADEKSNIIIQKLGIFGGGITTDLKTTQKFYKEDGYPAWTLRNEKNNGVAKGENVQIRNIIGRYLTNFINQEGHPMLQWGGAISLSGTNHSIENSILQFSDGPMISARGKSATIRNNIILDTNLRATVSEAVLLRLPEALVENNTILRTGRSAVRAEPRSETATPIWGGMKVQRNQIGFFGLQDWDVGGVCLTGVDGRGTLIHQNLIHDANTGPMKNGVYLDYAKNAIITDNVIVNVQKGIQTTARYPGFWDKEKDPNLKRVVNIVAAHNTIITSRAKGEKTRFRPVSTGSYNKFPEDAGRYFYNNILSGIVSTPSDLNDYHPFEYLGSRPEDSKESQEIGTVLSRGNIADMRGKPNVWIETNFDPETIDVSPKTTKESPVKIPEINLDGNPIRIEMKNFIGAWETKSPYPYGAINHRKEKIRESVVVQTFETINQNIPKSP